jgi:hypothetical protein
MFPAPRYLPYSSGIPQFPCLDAFVGGGRFTMDATLPPALAQSKHLLFLSGNPDSLPLKEGVSEASASPYNNDESHFPPSGRVSRQSP